MSKASRNGTYVRWKSGFTLIELMVVLVIMVIMSSVAMVSMAPALEEAKLRSGCRIIVADLTYARSLAVARQADTRVVFDEAENRVAVEISSLDENGEEQYTEVTTSEGRSSALPSGVKVEQLEKPATDQDEQDELYVGFTALGQGEDAVITVANAREKRLQIAVNAITGRCALTNVQVNE